MNPYDSPNAETNVEAEESDLNPPANVLWRAYAVAPAITPVSFVVLLFGVSAVATVFGVEVNPASLLVLPAVALTLGMLGSYFVAGAIGMPIAFCLRKRKLLNFYSIHATALLWSIAFTVACVLIMYRGPRQTLPLAALYLFCGITPPVLLSATMFWFLVRRNAPAPRVP